MSIMKRSLGLLVSYAAIFTFGYIFTSFVQCSFDFFIWSQEAKTILGITTAASGFVPYAIINAEKFV